MKTAKALGLNKGDTIRTSSGFVGVIIGQANTTTPLCEIWGLEREMGSCYAEDLRKITPLELTQSHYFKAHPEAMSKEGRLAIKMAEKPNLTDSTPKRTKPPTHKQIEAWLTDGVAKATDGCHVEPDGQCSHGCKSWLRELGLL